MSVTGGGEETNGRKGEKCALFYTAGGCGLRGEGEVRLERQGVSCRSPRSENNQMAQPGRSQVQPAACVSLLARLRGG